MDVLLVYDSVYRNTEKIAVAIGQGFPSSSIKVIKAEDVKQTDLEGVKLLIAGSPTQGGRAVANLQKFINDIPVNGLNGVKIAAFDTRMTGEGNFGIRLIVKVIGYAAGRILKDLQSKGGEPVTVPEGFIVTGREGPLKEGELERATAWGKQILLTLG